MKPLTRRKFIAATAAAAALPGQALGRKPKQEIIDLHQHTNYSGRNDERMLGHQRARGVKWTVLLPAGRLYGLAANCGGNKSVRRIAVKNPRNYVHFANEIADHPECIATIESFLKKGAVGIGEQKFKVECDSKHIQRIAELAQEYDVPVLMHCWSSPPMVGRWDRNGKPFLPTIGPSATQLNCRCCCIRLRFSPGKWPMTLAHFLNWRLLIV